MALDNLITGDPGNLAHLARHKRFRFVRQDVTLPFTVTGPVQYVWHLASPASPIDYAQLPIQTLQVGSAGTELALKLALKKKARFLLASTSEIYGDPLEHPQKESYWGHVNSIGPRSCYDEAKRFGEALTMAYHREHRVAIRIVRIFNTYGPRMRLRDGRVVPTFLSQALQGQPITVFGEGTQTRSFCYCSDLIDGLYRLMMSPHTEPVNLGNPREMTMLQFAESIRRLTGARSRIVHKPLPKDDPRQRRPDIGRARRWLGWKPRVALEEGLEKTVTYFKNKLGL